jgi:hypothetical protein
VLIGGGAILRGSLPSYRQIGGTFAVFLLLSIGVEVMPEIAAMFALLVLVTVFLETFGNVSGGLARLLGTGVVKG